MKKILLVILACSFLVASAKTPAQKLIMCLQQLQSKGVMLGHQDDTFYGTTWKWESNRSDVRDVCGDYPAVMGFELGKIELGSDKNLDGVSFNLMRKEIQAQYERGGIITISWHPYNPVTGNNAWDANGNAVGAVLQGGAQYAKMQQWIGTVIKFIKSLKTKDGKPIPVIFRPWHEMNGSWFWWGQKSCTPEQYKQLYQMTWNAFKKAKFNNIVWCFSPNAETNDTEEKYIAYYPGDKYIDLLGVDSYQNSTTTDFIMMTKQELNIMRKIAIEHKKLFALTEAGYRDTPQADWFTQGLLKAIENSGASYVLLWRNAWDNPKENFGPAPGKSCAEDFVRFYNDKSTLFINDINK
jgi:mannan endo-1,4-beta-mannosidase